MMSTREAFLQSILEAPDDDVPRLVFSDWLDDQGEEARAELIRAQCKLAKLSPWDREYQELSWRVEALLAEHRAAWVAELPRLRGIEWADFERGFVSTVRVDSVKALYANDAAIAAAAPVYRVEFTTLNESNTERPDAAVPWLRAVRMAGRREVRTDGENSILNGVEEIDLVRMHEYIDLRWLNTVDLASLKRIRIQGSHTGSQAIATAVLTSTNAEPTRLELGTRFIDYNSGYFEDPTMGPDGAVALAEAAHLKNLEALNLSRQRIGPRGLRAVLTSPTLANLRELEVRACQADDISAVQESQGRDIVRLDLSHTPLRETGLRTLAQAKRFARLERLDLDTCELDPKALTALTKAPFWKTLQYLDLSHNPLSTEGAAVLNKASEPAHLHTLILNDCDFDEETGAELGRIHRLKQLLSLDLSGNPLGSAGLQQLSVLEGGSIRRLMLAETGVDADAAAVLAKLWPQLIHLNLATNPLGNEGLAALSAGRTARELLSLNLSVCNVTAKGLKAFFKKGDCPQLRTLNLSGNSLTTATIQDLLTSPLLRTLRELNLADCRLTSAEAMLLAECTELAGLTVLNLRGNELGEAALVALATAAHLAHVELRLSGNPWTFKEKARKTLEKRLGSDWYYYPEEDATEDEFEEFEDDEYLDEDEDA